MLQKCQRKLFKRSFALVSREEYGINQKTVKQEQTNRIQEACQSSSLSGRCRDVAFGLYLLSFTRSFLVDTVSEWANSRSFDKTKPI
jgi:hypothetical protein